MAAVRSHVEVHCSTMQSGAACISMHDQPPEIAPRTTAVPRFVELDGLRGVAALVMVFHHALLTYPAAWAIWNSEPNAPRSGLFWLLERTPLYLLFSGPAAVMVFFVLSGGVLSNSYMRVDQGDYVSYLPKRLCRIWLPFAAALIGAAIFCKLLAHCFTTGLSFWFNQLSWNEMLTLPAFVKQALLLGPVTWLDNPMWSLVHELRISLVLPLLIIAAQRSRLTALLGTTVILVGTSVALPYVHNVWVSSLLSSGLYLLAFAAGCGLMLACDQIRARGTSASPASVFAAAAFGLLLLLSNSPANPLQHSLPEWVLLLGTTLGAAILVALALSGRATMLALRPVRWLGKVSYSLYLVHVPIILALLHASGGAYQLLLLAIAILISLATAAVMQATVERGSQILGRRIAADLIGMRAKWYAVA